MSTAVTSPTWAGPKRSTGACDRPGDRVRAPRPRRRQRGSRRPACRRRPGAAARADHRPRTQEVDQVTLGPHRADWRAPRRSESKGAVGTPPTAPLARTRREHAQPADGGDQPERQAPGPPRRRARRPRARDEPADSKPITIPDSRPRLTGGRIVGHPRHRGRPDRAAGEALDERAATRTWRWGPRRRSPWRPTSAPLRRA